MQKQHRRQCHPDGRGPNRQERRLQPLVERDHEDEICEMILMKSSMEDCSEIPNEGHAKESARITITSNNGMAETTRHANPLFFVKKQAAPSVLKSLKNLNGCLKKLIKLNFTD